MRKLEEVRQPTLIFGLADEHPDSINGVGLAVQPTDNAAQARIINFPASYHNGGFVQPLDARHLCRLPGS